MLIEFMSNLRYIILPTDQSNKQHDILKYNNNVLGWRYSFSKCWSMFSWPFSASWKTKRSNLEQTSRSSLATNSSTHRTWKRWHINRSKKALQTIWRNIWSNWKVNIRWVPPRESRSISISRSKFWRKLNNINRCRKITGSAHNREIKGPMVLKQKWWLNWFQITNNQHLNVLH